jgi:hypothetical protein
MSKIDLTKLQKGSNLFGDTPEDSLLLRDMQESALAYIRSFSWAQEVRETYLAFGIGGVIALFLLRFDKPIKNTDKYLWVVVGDVPSAYFVIDQTTDAVSAIDLYCELMQDWVDAVQSGGSLDNVFPVDASPTKANARLLQSRIRFIHNEIMPTIRNYQELR